MSDSKEIVDYEKLLGEMAQAAGKLERPTGATIGTRAGILSYGGNPVPNNKLQCIVVASAFSNTLYEGKFDPNNMQSPVCFAYGVQEHGETAEDVEARMVPHPNSQKPQHTDCKTCPNNKWGSDPEGGRGKACKNGRSLAVIPAHTAAENVATAEIAILRPPVTSVANWKNHVQLCLAKYNRPPLAVITEVGSVPDQRSQYKLTFTDIGVVDVSMLKPLIDRVPFALDVCQKIYEPNTDPVPDEDGEKKEKKSKKF